MSSSALPYGFISSQHQMSITHPSNIHLNLRDLLREIPQENALTSLAVTSIQETQHDSSTSKTVIRFKWTPKSHKQFPQDKIDLLVREQLTNINPKTRRPTTVGQAVKLNAKINTEFTTSDLIQGPSPTEILQNPSHTTHASLTVTTHSPALLDFDHLTALFKREDTLKSLGIEDISPSTYLYGSYKTTLRLIWTNKLNDEDHLWLHSGTIQRIIQDYATQITGNANISPLLVDSPSAIMTYGDTVAPIQGMPFFVFNPQTGQFPPFFRTSLETAYREDHIAKKTKTAN